MYVQSTAMKVLCTRVYLQGMLQSLNSPIGLVRQGYITFSQEWQGTYIILGSKKMTGSGS